MYEYVHICGLFDILAWITISKFIPTCLWNFTQLIGCCHWVVKAMIKELCRIYPMYCIWPGKFFEPLNQLALNDQCILNEVSMFEKCIPRCIHMLPD